MRDLPNSILTGMKIGTAQRTWQRNARKVKAPSGLKRNRLTNAQLRKILYRSSQDYFATPHHDRSLEQFRVSGHDFQDFIVGQVLSGQKLTIGRLVRAHDFLRSQARAPQQSFQFVRGQRIFDVVDALELDPSLSQGTLDLAACASSGLLVNLDRATLLDDHLSALSNEEALSIFSPSSPSRGARFRRRMLSSGDYRSVSAW